MIGLGFALVATLFAIVIPAAMVTWVFAHARVTAAAASIYGRRSRPRQVASAAVSIIGVAAFVGVELTMIVIAQGASRM